MMKATKIGVAMAITTNIEIVSERAIRYLLNK
jgi:hypothetical protein